MYLCKKCQTKKAEVTEAKSFVNKVIDDFENADTDLSSDLVLSYPQSTYPALYQQIQDNSVEIKPGETISVYKFDSFLGRSISDMMGISPWIFPSQIFVGVDAKNGKIEVAIGLLRSGKGN